MFAYIAGAPFVYIDQFHLTPQQFAARAMAGVMCAVAVIAVALYQAVK